MGEGSCAGRAAESTALKGARPREGEGLGTDPGDQEPGEAGEVRPARNATLPGTAGEGIQKWRHRGAGRYPRQPWRGGRAGQRVGPGAAARAPGKERCCPAPRAIRGARGYRTADPPSASPSRGERPLRVRARP